ncbi:MAG: glycosyltransferase family 9 protein [Chloroflexi bacterium]|nr:glycosyltransferase family 9 protein [Chloroflexota bacterium]
MKRSARNWLLRLVPLIVRRGAQRQRGKINRVLLIRPDHIGDILFTTPALRLLRSQLPDARITFLLGPWARAVLENNKNVDELIVYEFPWFSRRRKASPLEPYAVLLRLARSLQYYSFDTVINLRFDFWWGALAAYLAGIPRRIGYDIVACRPFLTDRLPYVPGRHEVEQNIGLIEQSLGLAPARWLPDRVGLDFVVTEADEKFAADYLAAKGIRDTDRLIALHPGSGSPTKLWGADRFAEMGQHLVSAYGCVLLLTGSAMERGLAMSIANRVAGKAIVTAGDTTLGQFAAILRRCVLAIGVDSGGMHLAASVGTPTVHLFGPSDHRLFGPWGDGRRHTVVRANLACSPCGRFDFGSSKGPSDCMVALETGPVLHEVARMLNSVGVGQVSSDGAL